METNRMKESQRLTVEFLESGCSVKEYNEVATMVSTKI
jgi:hypothetical protein